MSIINIDLNTSLLVMLSSDCCMPCFSFERKFNTSINLPLRTIRDTLSGAANLGIRRPNIFFLTGNSDPLDPSVAGILEDIPELVITPLMPIGQQELLLIPFSKDQTVIANSLSQIVDQAENIAGRPIILHITRKEVDKLSESLLLIQDFIGHITLRLCNITHWKDEDFRCYGQQLSSISNMGLMKMASSMEGKLNLLNLDVYIASENRNIRCPAGTGFIAIGPDASIYPCPTFYHKGKRFSVGSINDASTGYDCSWNLEKCNICESEKCPGCPFFENTDIPLKENICKVYEVESKARDGLLDRVSQSGYLFDCLRTLKTIECATKSQNEGGKELAAANQVHQVTFDEFVKSLKDIKTMADKSSNDDHSEIISYWKELEGIPVSSQKSVFRRRVKEVLLEIQGEYSNLRLGP